MLGGALRRVCVCAQAVHQGAAVLGLALVAMAEPVGGSMAMRSLEHLLQYGDPPVRCALKQPHKEGARSQGGTLHKQSVPSCPPTFLSARTQLPCEAE